MTDAPFQIIPVRAQVDLEATVQLFQGYAASIGIDLGYQDFSAEVADMPGKYAPPSGELLLARNGAGMPLDAWRSGRWQRKAAAR